jgi:AbrB family looped-hinge helix DNA binding protein
MTMKMPADKFMSSVKVGEKGQIVIPKEVREMFNIDPGDMLLLLADKERGIAIVDNDGLLDMARNIAGFAGKKEEEKP